MAPGLTAFTRIRRGASSTPAPTLDRLDDLGEQAVWVRGNTDRWLADAFDGTFQPSGLATNPPAAYFDWCAARIGRPHRDRLASLPLSVTLDVDGLGPVTFCHATTRDDNEFVAANVRTSASDAEALAAFNKTIEHQAGQRFP